MCLIVSDAEAIRECIPITLAQKKGIRMSPYCVGLITKEKVRIKLIGLGGTWVRLNIE